MDEIRWGYFLVGVIARCMFGSADKNFFAFVVAMNCRFGLPLGVKEMCAGMYV